MHCTGSLSGCSLLYSCHSSSSVTPLRRSSLCTVGQAGASRCTDDGSLGGNSKRSRTASSHPSGNGDNRPASLARATWSDRVEGETLMMRAISRLERPCSKCSRRTSWILRWIAFYWSSNPPDKNPAGCHSYPLAVGPNQAASNCPVWSGISVQFALKWVSSLPWNHCPVCAGLGVQFAVERVSSLARKTQTGKVS
jgi:hypothetical protein